MITPHYRFRFEKNIFQNFDKAGKRNLHHNSKYSIDRTHRPFYIIYSLTRNAN